ncbi:hypothetical protein B0H14DRAFT_3144736 [Mycena olivaceomarginata]|nr:hypothetical protein B0H14DRAFT_3144736 [Mycena olivaceomarginata]
MYPIEYIGHAFYTRRSDRQATDDRQLCFSWSVPQFSLSFCIPDPPIYTGTVLVAQSSSLELQDFRAVDMPPHQQSAWSPIRDPTWYVYHALPHALSMPYYYYGATHVRGDQIVGCVWLYLHQGALSRIEPIFDSAPWASTAPRQSNGLQSDIPKNKRHNGGKLSVIFAQKLQKFHNFLCREDILDTAVSGLLVSLDATLVPGLLAALQPPLVGLGGVVGGLGSISQRTDKAHRNGSTGIWKARVQEEKPSLVLDAAVYFPQTRCTILQGLTGTARGFLQIVPLVVYYVKLFLLGSTPRSVYGIKYGARSVAWGTTFPGITLLVVIALVYSVISPIINGLACFTFFAFYQLYKYLFLWQFEQPPSSHTGGLFFPKAITHIFVGLYIQQVCMAGLFFLARDQNQNMSSTPQAILMIALIVITGMALMTFYRPKVLFQMLISNSFGPLKHALPLSLADKTFSAVPGGERSETAITNKGAQEAHEMTEPKGAGGAGNRAARVKSEEEYGFAHPAASRPQRIVCFPHDRLGLAAEEERGCREAGVECSVKARRSFGFGVGGRVRGVKMYT